MAIRKWMIILLLLVLVLLPRHLAHDDLRGYEVILKEAVAVNEDIFEKNHEDQVKQFALLSPSFYADIEGKSLRLSAVRGDLTPWYKSRTGSVNRQFDQYNQLVLSEKSSQSVFFTGKGLHNQVDYDKKVFSISDIANLDGLKLQEGQLDGLISYPEQTEKVERIYIAKYDKNGNVLSNSDIDKWLSKYGISGGVRTDYIALNAMKNSLKVTAETFFLLILLILVAKRLVTASSGSWKNADNYLALSLLILLLVMFMRIPFQELPLEWMDEKIVSLSFYVDTILNAKVALYGGLNDLMTLQGFSEKIDIFLLVIWYLVIAVAIHKVLKIKET